MAFVTVDPRIQAGAYISRDGQLWRVMGVERDDNGAITGLHELENVVGKWSAYGGGKGMWIHEQIAHTATEIADQFELIK